MTSDALDMSILTASDEDIYYSSGLIDEEKLPGFLAMLTGVVEGFLGAQRQLERRSYKEEQVLHQAQREYFVRCWPIDTTQEITIELRGVNRRNRFRRPCPDGAWETLDPQYYEVKTNSIEFLDPEVSIVQNFNRRGYSAAAQQIELKLSYTGGFNFEAADLSQDAIAIKFAMGQLLEYHALRMGASVAGIKSEDVYRESKIEYFGSSEQGSSPGTVAVGGWPEYLLLPFHKYRPYQYRF
ncbi:MAG: hypothetical protein ACRC62_03530 [Microcoleus sp.]